MVVDGDQVESVLLGDEGAGQAPGPAVHRHVDDRPARGAADRRAAWQERGVVFMDAPVTGSSPKAEDGTLTIMAGGADATFERARPLFDAMGELVLHVGDGRAGSAREGDQQRRRGRQHRGGGRGADRRQARAGADLDALVTVIRAGSGASAMLELKAGPMRAHDWSTLFKLEHMLKDLRLCLEEARGGGRQHGVDRGRPRASSPRPSERGLGERDFAALLEVVEERSGARLEPRR